MNKEPVQDKPQDLSMKNSRRVKLIPPPLDLNARTLINSEDSDSCNKSPADLPRECLPIRKRALVEVRKDLVSKSPKSGAAPSIFGHSSSSSAPPIVSLSSPFTHFPVPPLIPVPYPKSPYINGFPTPPTTNTSELPSPFHWNSSFFSPFTNFTPSSSLLSPAPSYPSSSTNSSREDIGEISSSLLDSKRRLLTCSSGNGFREPMADSSSPIPSSPLLSPRNWSHSWPTPIWQCFVTGTLVKFLLPNLETPWQKVEELGWKDRLASKVDSKNPYQYAPHGLAIVNMDLRPSRGSEEETCLRLRMAPHRRDNSPEILADCSMEHPFFVKDKGWSSAHARLAIDKYGIPCQELAVGDVCLPPNHPEAVRTPDLCDRFRRFEFTSDDLSSRNKSKVSPPSSPAKIKKEKDPEKPKRPMNGFMLFAKKYRLELIQQHPGKDNRAISVLLGESWKSLPALDREAYSSKAKIMADEQKKLHPDCWKRKRTLTPSLTPTLVPNHTQHFFGSQAQ